jgi:hypothetical protein
MILGTRCLGEASMDAPAIHRALERVGLDEVLISVENAEHAPFLEDVPVAAVQAAWADRGAAVATAKAASRVRRLVLELPVDAEVDGACRRLFELARQVPGLPLAVITPAAGELARPDALELVLDDLATLPVGYWHRPARAHLLGIPDTAWLDLLGRRLVGLSLDDVAGDEAGLPPGLGELDFSKLSELTARSLDVVLDTDPVPDVALLRVAVETLRGLGFP